MSDFDRLGSNYNKDKEFRNKIYTFPSAKKDEDKTKEKGYLPISDDGTIAIDGCFPTFYKTNYIPEIQNYREEVI